jgi:hypothetical protein
MMQLAKADKKLNTVLKDTMYAAPMKQLNVDPAKHVTTKPVVKPPVKKDNKKIAKSANDKAAVNKNTSGAKKPKAVMPKKH